MTRRSEVWVLAPSAEPAETLRRTAWPEVRAGRHQDHVFGTSTSPRPPW
jgi:hypothetical protein